MNIEEHIEFVNMIQDQKRAASNVDWRDGIEAHKRENDYRRNRIDPMIKDWIRQNTPPFHSLCTLDAREMSPAKAAICLYFALARYIFRSREEGGMSPAWELMCLSPEKEAEHWDHHRPDGVWRVSWESGPIDWAVSVSCGGNPWEKEEDFPTLKGYGGGAREFFTEPYYGFDLCFIET